MQDMPMFWRRSQVSALIGVRKSVDSGVSSSDSCPRNSDGLQPLQPSSDGLPGYGVLDWTGVGHEAHLGAGPGARVIHGHRALHRCAVVESGC